MNNSRIINIAGSAFYIDDDAYSVLHTYLNSIENNLGKDTDKQDVMRDIEARVAELFADMKRMKHVEVVSLEMVNAVMEQLGKPDDFKEAVEQGGADSTNQEQSSLFDHKLYRDIDNQIVGGVCSGLGYWLGVDAIWIRIIFLLCLFLWGVTLPLYVILWIVMPPARTSAQRIDMRREEPTVENIEREIENRRQQPVQSSNSGCMTTVLKVLIWGTALLCVFIVGTVFLSLITATISLLPLGFTGVFFVEHNWEAILLAVMLVLVIGIPVFAVIYAIVKSSRQGSRISPAVLWTCLFLWLIAAVVSVGLGIFGFARELIDIGEPLILNQ